MCRNCRHLLALAGRKGEDMLPDHTPDVGTQVSASGQDLFPDVLLQYVHDPISSRFDRPRTDLTERGLPHVQPEA